MPVKTQALIKAIIKSAYDSREPAKHAKPPKTPGLYESIMCFRG
ncbi:hypothetical protein [Syntrophomonas wolfei]|nr:hypothetical protein [Syntrophomonas wolfei]